MQTKSRSKAKPKSAPTGRRQISVSVRLYPDELDQLRVLASAGDRSLNREMVRALRGHLAAHAAMGDER